MPDTATPAPVVDAQAAQAAVAAAVQGDATAAPARRPDAFERLEAAKAEALKGETGTDAKPPAAGEPAKPAPTEPEKRAARGLAEIAEREAAIVETQRATKAERAAIEADRKAFAAQSATFTKAQELVKAGDHLGALAALGIDLEKAQDQYLDTMRNPSPEETARKAAREEWQRIQDETKAADDLAAAEKLKTHETALATARNGYMDETETAFTANREEFDFIVAYGITPDAVLAQAIKMERETGKTPEPLEAMRAIERDLADRAGKTKKFGSAVKAAPAGDKQGTDEARDSTPRTLTTRNTGSVPLTKPSARKQSAFERLQEAKREAGV